MNSYLKTFLRGSAVSLAGAALLGITNYLTRRILCNSMSLADYGLFYSTFALFSIVFGFTDLGLTQTGTVMIASSAEVPSERNRIFSHLFWIKTAIALFCGTGIAVFCQLNQSDADMFFILVFLVYFIVQVFNGTLQALWGGLKKYTPQQVGYCATAMLTVLSLCILSAFDLRSVASCHLFAVLIVFVAGLIYSRVFNLGRLEFRLSREICQTLLTTGGITAVTTTLISLMYNISVVMLDKQRGAESAGLYNIALPIMQIVQAAMVFPAVFLPIAVDMSKRFEYIQLRSFVRMALLTAVVALVPTGVFFYYCSPMLIRILFKPEYVGAACATTLLCLGLVFFTLGNFLFQIMLSLHKAATMAVIAVITTVCCLLLNYFLINRSDVNGAAVATLISYTVFALLTYVALEYYIKKMKREYENAKDQELAA